MSMRSPPISGLDVARAAGGDRPAALEDADRDGELVGFLEVLGGQQNGAARGGERADRLPHLVAVVRVQAGGRSHPPQTNA